jgi:hypothetical protein
LLSPEKIAADQCKLLVTLFAVFGDDATTALTKLGHWTTVSSPSRKHAADADGIRGIPIAKSHYES